MNPPGWIYRVLEKRSEIENIIGYPLGSILGFGHFGCVFSWKSPWVVKITRDPNEGAVWSFLQDFLNRTQFGRNGIVRINRVMRLKPDIKWRGRLFPVHLIIREEVAPAYGDNIVVVGRKVLRNVSDYTIRMIKSEYDADEFNSTINGIILFKVAANKFYKALNIKRKNLRDEKIREAEELINSSLSSMSGFFGNSISELYYALLDESVILRDVHIANIGWRIHEEIDGDSLDKCLVIFDPGHTPMTASREIDSVDIGYKPNL